MTLEKDIYSDIENPRGKRETICSAEAIDDLLDHMAELAAEVESTNAEVRRFLLNLGNLPIRHTLILGEGRVEDPPLFYYAVELKPPFSPRNQE